VANLIEFKVSWEGHGPANVWTNLSNVPSEVLARWAAWARQYVLDALQQAAPKKTGAYAKAITASEANVRGTSSAGVHIEFYGPGPRTSWLLRGTAPHLIVASGATGGSGPRALAFDWKGQHVVVTLVHHPGAKPNPFNLVVAQAVAGPLGEHLRQELEAYLQETSASQGG